MFEWIKVLRKTHKRCCRCNEVKPNRQVRYMEPATRRPVCDMCYNRWYRTKW